MPHHRPRRAGSGGMPYFLSVVPVVLSVAATPTVVALMLALVATIVFGAVIARAFDVAVTPTVVSGRGGDDDCRRAVIGTGRRWWGIPIAWRRIDDRSEERRGGKEGVSTGRSRGWLEP